MKERRRHPRVPVELPATLVLPGRSACAGAISDISLGGTMFVLPTRPPAEVGSHAVFCLEEPRPALETVVRVMRMSIIEAESAPLSHGVGLQFVSPSSATRAKLSRLAKSGREQD